MSNIIDVIIPVLNEEESIGKVIKDIPKELTRNIYVIDNGSSDQSKNRAAESGAIVLDESKRGYGAACFAGIHYICYSSQDIVPDAIVFLDGDYSDRPKEMYLLINKLELENLDLVIGSRTLGDAEKGSLGVVQQIGNALSTFLIRILFSYGYTDLGPFRIIRFSKLLEMKMEDRDYGWTVEMQVKAAKLKMKIGEVPVSYKKRIGKSKISGTLRGIFGASVKILYTIFKTYVKG